MIKKRSKKIVKIFILILIRQGWKLGENLYNLMKNPFVTLKRLIKDRDKSQIFLLGMTFLMPILLYITARIVWDYYRYGLVINGVGLFFKIVIVIEVVFLGYLGYWITKVFLRK